MYFMVLETVNRKRSDNKIRQGPFIEQQTSNIKARTKCFKFIFETTSWRLSEENIAHLVIFSPR